MELAAILLVVCVLVLSIPSASAESGQLVLRHAYPENTNFSYIELTCLYENPELQSLAVGADFQLNGTDIEEELNVTDIGNGTIRFILAPEKEDFFTCSLNGTLANNSIGLAAQPSIDYSGQSRSHEMELPDADSVVSTELQCDIQLGALRQRYSVQWKQIYIIVIEGMFNLTLNVSSSLNGSQYQCRVTIDHDGTIVQIQSYDGVLITLVITTAAAESGQLVLRHDYPENTNFSYIELTCLYENPELHSLAVGADFQLNGTDIEEELNVIDIGNGTIRFILAPEKEDFFTCSLNGSVSNNSIGLAGKSGWPSGLVYLSLLSVRNLSTESTTPYPGTSVISVLVAIAVVGTIACFLVRNSLAYKKWLSYSPRDCEQHNGFKLESQEQVKVEPLQTSALETPPQHIPKWLHPVATLTDCTSDGRSYYDEHNDFRLEIPEGAIPEGERVTIDIAVALYGPFQYLTGFRPVSPVFWVCVRDRENIRFLTPFKVTIEHCLRLDRDTDTHSLGLIFMKAGHTLNSAGKYELQSADGAQDFQSDLSHGTLTTDHFCFLCIKAKDDHETAKRNGYFLIPAYVNPIVARENQVMQFFITLKLKCCIETVKFQCQDKGYEFHFRQFNFNLVDGDGVLTIKYTCTEPEMWKIALTSSEKISAKDVLFDKNDVEYMKLLENSGQYPPRFSLELGGTDSTKMSEVKFEFMGATEKLVIEILLPKGTGLGRSQLMTPSHVTASETDQYTKDNERHPAVKTSVAIAIEGEDHQNIAGRNSGEIFQATPQPENLFLPRYSADTAQHIPEWLHPVATLTDCTSDGRSYYDERNDFRLEIPEGAIPEGERVIIDIDMALYGPFQYPKGLKPVSPVLRVCVRGRENFHFLKPVKITIEHCLHLDRDTDTHSLGLTFLKAGHTLNSAGKYELQSAGGAQDFQSDLSHGTLTTDHFCFLCINATDDHETAKRNGYFLIRAHVDPIPARGIHAMEFFVTLKLKCCVGTVKDQCRDRGYGFHFRQFNFNHEDSDSVLTIKYTCTEPEMWNIGLTSSEKISAKDVLFDKNDVELMKLLENTGQYPPRFSLGLDGTDSTKKSKVKFEFTGAAEEVVIEVLLPQDVQYPTSSVASNVSRLRLPSSLSSDITGTGLGSSQLMTPPNIPITLKLGINDLHEVFLAVQSLAGRWNMLGLALGLYQPQLAKIKGDVEDCLLEVLTQWLNQNYVVQKFGEPSWPVLVNAVDSHVGGKNPALALDIAQKYNILQRVLDQCVSVEFY